MKNILPILLLIHTFSVQVRCAEKQEEQPWTEQQEEPVKPKKKKSAKDKKHKYKQGTLAVATGAIAAGSFLMFLWKKPTFETDGNDGVWVSSSRGKGKLLVAREESIVIYSNQNSEKFQEEATISFPDINQKGQIFAYELLRDKVQQNIVAVACKHTIKMFDVEKRVTVSTIHIPTDKKIVHMSFANQQAYLAVGFENNGTYIYKRNKSIWQQKSYLPWSNKMFFDSTGYNKRKSYICGIERDTDLAVFFDVEKHKTLCSVPILPEKDRHDFTLLNNEKNFSWPSKVPVEAAEFKVAISGRENGIEGVHFYTIRDRDTQKGFFTKVKKGNYTLLCRKDKETTTALRDGHIFEVADYQRLYKTFTRHNPYMVDRLSVGKDHDQWIVAIGGGKLCLWNVYN